jgi:gentisate 1,2-dioxygenase
MTQTLAPADVSHYYQRLAELSTLPFWQLPDITDTAGPERGHAWSWHDILPALTRSREIVDEAAALQRRALILRNPGLTRQPSVPPLLSRPPTRCCSPARPHPSMPIPCRPCGSGWPAAGPA